LRTLVCFGAVQGAGAVALLLAKGIRPVDGPLRPLPGLALAAVLAVGLFVGVTGAVRVGWPPRCAELALVIAVASIEEVLWRGGLLGSLAAVVSARAALVLATLGFAAAHLTRRGLRGFVVHMATGATFGVSYLASGSLWAPVLAHGLYNLLVASIAVPNEHIRNGHLELGAVVWRTVEPTVESSNPKLTPAAVLEGVTKRFGETAALVDVTLEVGVGEVTALLGPNGAGKTTALSLLLGLRRPDHGTARLFGVDPRRPAARVAVGVTPQEVGFPETLRVREVVTLVRAHFADAVPTDLLLARFGLERLASRQTGGLSGGERRRLAVALAFAGRPRAVFLDEPTAGLDVESRLRLWEAVRAYVREGGTVLLTTHYVEEAEALSTRVAVLDRGRLVLAGPVREVVGRAGLSRVRIRARRLPRLEGVVRMTWEEGGWTLYTHDAGELVTELVRRGVPLDGLEVKPANLEQAFLALTGPGA
jgi:ABC-2 type transport system ATP-binding protein